MTLLRNRLIHLTRCRGITRRIIRKILQHDPTLTNVFEFSSQELSLRFSLSKENASTLYKDLHNDELRRQIKRDQEQYGIITLVDEAYPHMLKTIRDCPIVLYAVGDPAILRKQPALSVIGTRNPSHEAMKKVEYIVSPLVRKKWVVVSGMAKGIDSYAHRISLMDEGYTIAILGSGFHYIYPKQNISLFKEISQKGLVLTEYPPDVPPKPYHFPERNRIISGLSFGTLVIEATERSGTLITVDQALDQGRDVYAVPGSPLIPQTRGCHQLIQDGAKLVVNYEDIMVDWETTSKY